MLARFNFAILWFDTMYLLKAYFSHHAGHFESRTRFARVTSVSRPVFAHVFARVQAWQVKQSRPERRGTSYDITPRSGLFSHAHTDAKFTLLAATTRQQLLIPSWFRRTRSAMVYIRQDKLPKLKEYKYSGVDHSLLSQYVLKPFYTHVVIKCFPMWMA